MLSINTNLSSLLIQSNLSRSTNGLDKAIERLSTGFKINHASDNAANYSISNKMSVELSSLNVLEDNTAQGIDMLDTAEGALTNIQDLLSRIRILTVEALNGTYSTKTRQSLQAEANALMEEITRIRNNTEYNGQHVLGDIVEENCYPTSTPAYTPPVALTLSAPMNSAPEEVPPVASAPRKLAMMKSSAPMLGASGSLTGSFDLSSKEKIIPK